MKHPRRADDSYKLRVFNLWRGESTSACRLLVSFSTCGRVGTTRVSGGPAGCCFPCCAFFRRSDRPVLGRCWARASDFSGRPGRTLGVADASLLFARLRVLMDRWRAKFLHSGQVELLARGRKRRGCSLFSAISVTASKSTPPSVCLGSFPPFQGVGKNKQTNTLEIGMEAREFGDFSQVCGEAATALEAGSHSSHAGVPRNLV